MRSRAWLDRAVCRDSDPDEFFPTPPRDGAPSASYEMAVNSAKAHCRRCPVVNDCLLFALSTGQAHGIWGGMTEAERDALLQAGAGEASA